MRFLIGGLFAAVLMTAGVAVAGDDSPRGWLRNQIESYVGGDGSVQGDLTLENGEKISNSTDDLVCWEGDGGTSDEDICFDLDGANTIGVSSTTGVTSVDWGSLDHLIGDLSATDITLSGDLSAVGITLSGNVTAVDATLSGDLSAVDIVLTGTLTATGATLTGAVDIQGVLSDSSGALCIGAACDAAGTTGNVTIGGALLTVDNAFQADGTATFNVGLSVASGYEITAGSTYGSLMPRSSGQTIDPMAFLTGSVSNTILVQEWADRAIDMGHAQQPNPTLFWHSADATDTTQWIGLAHDQTDGLIDVGSGILRSVTGFTVGQSTDDAQPVLSVVADADSDAGGDTSETLGLTLTPNADPTLATWDFTSTQSAGYKFDKTVTHTVAPVFADYTRHHDVPIGAAIVGAAAPGQETIGTYRCYVFDANADLAYINVEVPTEWNETSDMAIDLIVFTDDGDALGNGEVMEFDLVYRSVAIDEAYDNGTAVTIVATTTGGASETDKGLYKLTATVDHDNGNQPLAPEDTLGFSIMRDVDVSDTYSGDVHVCRAQLVYSAHALASH